MTFHCFWNLDLVRKASLPQASHPHISPVLLTALFHCRLLNFIWTLERFSLFMASYLLLVSFGLLSLVSFLWSLFTGLSLVAFSPLESLQPPLHALRDHGLLSRLPNAGDVWTIRTNARLIEHTLEYRAASRRSHSVRVRRLVTASLPLPAMINRKESNLSYRHFYLSAFWFSFSFCAHFFARKMNSKHFAVGCQSSYLPNWTKPNKSYITFCIRQERRSKASKRRAKPGPHYFAFSHCPGAFLIF